MAKSRSPTKSPKKSGKNSSSKLKVKRKSRGKNEELEAAVASIQIPQVTGDSTLFGHADAFDTSPLPSTSRGQI